jgi:integrase
MLPPQFLSMTLRDIRPATFSKLWRTVAQTPTGYYKDGSPKPCYAAATIYSLRIMLVTAMGPLVTSGLYTVNPASAAKLRTPERKDRRMMDEADIDALLQAMEGDRARAVIITLLTTAMRAGEAMALKWEHVDFAAGTIAIRGNAPHREGTLEIKEPKRRSHRRTLYLPAITRDALLRHRDLQAIERESAGDEWQDLGLVFPNERGGIGRQWATVGRPLKRVLALAKLPDMRVHDLRHNCATLLIERGHNFKAVSEQLGHASTSTTLDIYGHVLPGRGATLAREMDLITGFSAPRIAPVAPAVASETEKTTNQGQNTG